MPNHLKLVCASIVVVALILLGACSDGSSGSSSDDADSTNGEEQSADEGSPTSSELMLDTSSRPHAVHLAWTGADTVDIYFSTDPECDWDAYGSCPASGLITNVEGQESLLAAPADGLLINRAHWFVVAAGDRISDPMPWSSETVYGVASDGHGCYFYFGDFEWFMGEPRKNIAHVDEFARLAAVDAGSGELQTWQHDLHPEVLTDLTFLGSFSLEVQGDVLYVGGRFQGTEHMDQSNLIALTAADGTWVDWVPPEFESLSRIRALQTDDNWVCVAGGLDSIAGYPGRNLVVFSNASQGSEASIRW
ncbi:MAG: hypothetical protein LAT62_11420 [Natronospirillum sp.]|uniref:hypothetical protein n=1 Tax=Natronospirillum sp. TaxID=2812955 RepID=UPI0025EBDFB2|nr:hypothetical protein [Natronospirillum sp.]MCH8552539.1 hypothetical protein [Natronospirillum sp.]